MVYDGTRLVDGLRQVVVSVIVMVSSMVLLSLSYAPSVAAGNCGGSFLGMPAWYDGVTDANCQVKIENSDEGLTKFIWRVALNVIEALMMLVGYASVVMIIVGGFFYMTATGQADKIKSAKSTIMNAIIGLVIAVSSVAIVNIIQGVVK